MTKKQLPVLVAGGGLGGMGVALALGRRGIAVRVLEQAAEIAGIGYGIQLGPNIFPVFEALGIRAPVLDAAHEPTALVMPDSESGKELLRIALHDAHYTSRYRDPYVVIHRGDLHEILLRACAQCPSVELVTSANVVAYRSEPDAIVALTDDNRQHAGVALIAADGVRSRLRGNLVSEQGPRPIGYVAHRTTIPIDDVPAAFPYRDEVVALWAGPGHHVVHYPLRHGSLFNLVAVFRLDQAKSKLSHQDAFDATFANVLPELRTLIDLMDLERRWDLSDRDPIRRWHDGRFVLLGDAAHPALQSLAQGACMALEDGACLADLIAASAPLTTRQWDSVFDAYQRQRLLRTARVQLESRSLWQFYHAGGIERDVRNAELASRSIDDTFHCVDWLWRGPTTT